MSENALVLMALLVVILIVALAILARNKNFKQSVHLPGVDWDLQTTNSVSKDRTASNGDSPHEQEHPESPPTK